MVSFSIIICAFNAIGRLRKTLKHISMLDYPTELVEIIFVDNNSTDGTRDFVNDLWMEFNAKFTLRLTSEYNQGLNYARKCGIREARFDYVVFCDDDNWLSSQYLNIANKVLTQNTTIGVLGGQGIPVTDAERFPNWFYTYGCGYAIGVQGMKSGDISARGCVWGAAAIARRDLIANVLSAGHEFLLSGRKGSEMSSGDDSEMCKWYLLAGYQLWYDETMIFHHFIPKERLTLEYAEKLFKGFNDSSGVLSVYNQYLHLMLIRRSFYKRPMQWAKYEIEFLMDKSPYKMKVVALAKHIKLFNVM